MINDENVMSKSGGRQMRLLNKMKGNGQYIRMIWCGWYVVVLGVR